MKTEEASDHQVEQNKTVERLKNKAIEAFLLAIEIYNKPTIKYRVEGFALFVVNAWELMLKAVIVKRDGEQAIYFQDNQNRTVSLEGCIRKVFTNEKDPLRLNLEKIIDLRNTSTHFITEEYEAVYVPLFQANIINFSAKINEFLNVDITDYIPENFLSLSVSFHVIDEGQIRGKYSDAVSARLLESAQKIANLCSVNGSRFAITVTHEHYITKKIGDTTNVMRIAKEGEDPLMIVQKKTDPTKTHPFTAQSLMDCLNDKLRRTNVKLTFHGEPAKINQFHFTNLCKHFGIKENSQYCFVNNIYKKNQYSYSKSTIDFLFEMLSKEPDNILEVVARDSRRKK